MIEHLSKEVGTLAAENAREVRQQLSNGHADRCIICDDVSFDGWEADYSGGCRVYYDRCRDCGRPRQILIFYFTVTRFEEWSATDTRISSCGHQCTNSIVPEISADTFSEKKEYRLEYPRIFNKKIHEHHVSYEPEVTVPVCSKCHGRIHRDDSDLEAFDPEMKRVDWEEA